MRGFTRPIPAAPEAKTSNNAGDYSPHVHGHLLVEEKGASCWVPITAPIKVELQQRGNDWVAYLWGRSAPILRTASGYMSSAAHWSSREEAEAELPRLLGHDIEVVRVTTGKPY